MDNKKQVYRAKDEKCCQGMLFLQVFLVLVFVIVLLWEPISYASKQKDVASFEGYSELNDTGASLSHGKSLYKTCTPCHGEQGEGDYEQKAPSIAHLKPWYIENQLKKFIAGHRAYDTDDIQGLRMRPMARALKSEEAIRDVAAYVSTLDAPLPSPILTHGDAAKGKAAYAVCVACHGQDASGNEVLNAPALTGLNDWYLVAQLKHFKSGMRGTHSEDLTGAQMRPMAMTLASDEAIHDVVAYIMKLQKEQ